MLAEHKPDVVCLQECYDAPDLVGKVPGYRYRYQGYGYPPKTKGYVEERSNQVILVRDGVEVKVSAALEMEIPWKGPVLGAWHDPRVHRRVTVRKDGVIWRVIDFHGPFGSDAVGESNAAMVNCLTTFPQTEPIIIVGDFNQNNSTVVTRIGSKGEAVVDGAGIDLAVYKNCRKVIGQNFGNFGSDHPMKMWTFEA
jgi:exonuclease III